MTAAVAPACEPLPEDPIVVCGAPRTGVRLLAAVLDGHPSLASGPELPFLITMARQWLDIDQTLGTNHERHYGVSRESTRAAFRGSVLKFFVPRLASAAKRRFVMHSFAAALSLDVLGALFPSARFIVTMRDPRDVAHSLLQRDWRNPRDGRPLPYTQSADAAAQLCVDFMPVVLQSALKLQAGGRLALLRYEDLCCAPGTALSKLAIFLGEEAPDDRVAAGSATSVAMSADEPHPPLRVGTLDATSVGSWRTGMRAEDAATVERITAPLLDRFGYER